MRFGINKGYGLPFYLNNKIAGWVCGSTNGAFRFVLANHKTDDRQYFKSEHTCKLALMKLFGE